MHPYLTTLALLLPLLPILWLYTAQIARSPSFPKLRNKRICLLIAHPDDEAMFFAPTLLALTDPAAGNHVKILCLSTGTPPPPSNYTFWVTQGNASSLGPIRKTELLQSALLLGLRSTSDVFILDSPDFPDNMSTVWDATKIASVLASAFAPKLASPPPPFSSSSTTSSSSAPPEATIDALITFDKHGVSNHANHKSLYHGALAFLRTLMHNHNGWECPVTLYTLTSTSLLRKYISVLDAPITMLFAVLATMRLSRSAAQKRTGSGRGVEREKPRRMLFVNGIREWRKAQKAMTGAHRSQMRWFRWGWVGVGRFMVVNDLRREGGF
ncbi:MAG: N-acetylglucosaminyl-phosphatidylinositol de-N-acetylase [Pleopsidium flavum]|nr:MAG: N-acetylglucosaminyl-phosphatidylinositol de-N-acetylase [Pleopsidium flavum]